jgi:hypothetical protein
MHNKEVEKALLEAITTISATTSTYIEATTVLASDLSMNWESKEAQAIFKPNESESSALKAIKYQIEVLKQALALSVATYNLRCWTNWNMCCEVAIVLVKRMGLCTT